MSEQTSRLQSRLFALWDDRRVRLGLLCTVGLLLLGLAVKFALDLVPRHQVLSVTSGSVLHQRHLLVKFLQEELASRHLSLRIVKSPGSLQALEDVNDGKLDMAFVQGGLDGKFPNVTHVATVAPELIHFLVKPHIRDIADLKGTVINMGDLQDGTRVISNKILRVSGLTPEKDYIETNHPDEELMLMKPELLPDVIVQVSYAPSDIVDFLVRKRGYHLLEMSFPPSLAMRLGWVADSRILGYMYSIIPPIPARDIEVVGVNLHLVANKHVDPGAIASLLETLYGPRMTSRLGRPVPEASLLLPSGFDISAGTELYLSRKQPLLTQATIEKLKSLAALLATLVSLALMIRKAMAEREAGADKARRKEENEDPQKSVEDVKGHIEDI